MTVAAQLVEPQILTYEDYLREGTVYGRYDIVDGVRIFMASLTPLHQDITFNIGELLRAYQRRARHGRMYVAPRDVRVSLNPLRTRQPDVLFISHEWIGGQSLDNAAPFAQAPELVVEVLSDSDTRATRLGKIRDFCAVGVNECWLVSPEGEMVEVLRLTPEGPERVALYGAGQTLQSITFDDLTVALDDIFRIEE
jgi:Uma2 family endonuclease